MQESETSTTSSSSTSSSSDSHSQSDGESDSSDEYDSDSSVNIISSTMSSLAAYRPIRPLPRRKSTQPQIVVLGDTSAKQEDGSLPGSRESQA